MKSKPLATLGDAMIALANLIARETKGRKFEIVQDDNGWFYVKEKQ
jgi:hypothetical protein